MHANFTTETIDAKTGDKFPLSACPFLSNWTFRRNTAEYFGIWRRRDLLTTTRVISSPPILQYWTLHWSLSCCCFRLLFVSFGYEWWPYVYHVIIRNHRRLQSVPVIGRFLPKGVQSSNESAIHHLIEVFLVQILHWYFSVRGIYLPWATTWSIGR